MILEGQIDVSEKNICIYDLDEYYGKSILNKEVILFANDEGVIVESFTREGKLKDLLNDKLLGDFFSDMKVILIESYEGCKICIDYEWDEETRIAYAKSLLSYYGDDTEYLVFSDGETLEGKGYAGYMAVINYIKDLDLDELIKIEHDDDRLKISDSICYINLREC